MAWRVNAQHKSAMTQLGMNWGLCIGALVVVLPTVWTVTRETKVEDERGGVQVVSDTKERELEEFEGRE